MTEPAGTLLEVTVESVAGARAALAGGAGRLELCTGLAQGGLTPSAGLLAEVSEAVSLPLFVLIRPRPGDFLYDAGDLAVMRRDIVESARHGADGVVIGALDGSGAVDRVMVRALIEAARPMAVTFHRAVDVARDLDEALDALLDLGVERVLSSGQARTAEEGIPVLARMVRKDPARLTVIAAGGVRAANARRIVAETGVREIHSSAAVPRSVMHPGREGITLGRAGDEGGLDGQETDAAMVAAIVAQLRDQGAQRTSR
jgi:copper homeostasis protein